MTPTQREQWNNRPMVITVTELCETCSRLRGDVEKRDIGIWNRVWFKSCMPCAQAEQQKMIE